MNQYEQFQKEQGIQPSQPTERELGWDDNITQDAQEFVLLPEGDYDFTVENFERARYGGGDKLPPCNKAIVNIRIESQQGVVVITHNLFLHTKTEGMLSAFFASIGQKKKGEPLRMNWNLVPGSKGRLKLGHRLYKGDTYSEIKKFYPKEDAAFQSQSFNNEFNWNNK